MFDTVRLSNHAGQFGRRGLLNTGQMKFLPAIGPFARFMSDPVHACYLLNFQLTNWNNVDV